MSIVSTSQHKLTLVQRFNLGVAIKKSFALNPLLTLLGFAMIVTLIATFIGVIVDHRVITGVPAWVKPAKFAISTGVYSFTLLWMLSFIQGHKRLVRLIANATAVGFFVEMVLITGQVIRGTTSHFNFSTPLDGTIYIIMATFITLVWCMTFIAAILLLLQRMSNPIFAWSLRLGILLSLIGMAVATLMTLPTAMQLTALHAGGHLTNIGAHSVGVADGGPGLPFLGWSTVGGDLRIPHFVGLHALQVIPFVGWLLMLLQTSTLRIGHRLALLWTFSISYLGVIALLTWQALRAQSIIAPDTSTLQAFAALLAATAFAIIAIVTHAHMRVVDRGL